ncbi:MAG: hypothetical protein H6755_01515 [Candidatus Omnitrophica bacterium]|nr:hypothetical protein [Candidatus Omnitrophota bacterium]
MKNNMISHFKNEKKRQSQKGQVAVVLILLTAFALIFYAVSLNMGRMSAAKTVTTTASNIGAAQLGSQMASYGWRLARENLKGKRKLCSTSSFLTGLILSAIFSLGFTLIFFLVYQISPEAAKALSIYYMFSPMIIGSLIFYNTVRMDEKINKMWNKQQNNLPLKDRFLEGAIQAGLRNAVTEQVNVPDVLDFNNNSIYGFDGLGEPKDTISRFSVYYDARLSGIKAVETTEVKNFMEKLTDFLRVGGADPWGLYDPWPVEDSTHECFFAPGKAVPSECNPCCLPETIPNVLDLSETIEIRPECCDDNSCGTVATCSAMSPYGIPDNITGQNYPWVFDFIYENRENNANPLDPDFPSNAGLSFRELLGRDDEHPYYFKNILDINSIRQFPHALGAEGYQVDDATGFVQPKFVDPELLATTPFFSDAKSGIFPFLYKFLDWGMDLGRLDIVGKTEQCHWCYYNSLNPGAGVTQCPADQPFEIPQLQLPNDPNDPATPLLYNRSFCVDGIDVNNPVDPFVYIYPILPADKIDIQKDLLTGFLNVEAESNVCAELSGYLSGGTGFDKSVGFWKRGSEQFCSTNWPYSSGCPGHGICEDNIDCECLQPGAGSPDNFRSDLLDDLIYGLNEFISFSETLIKQSEENLTGLVTNFNEWYEEIAIWIEPEPGRTDPLTGTAADCYLCNADPGALWIWLDELKEIRSRFVGFRDRSYAGTACTEVWCVPPQEDPANPAPIGFPPNPCPGIPADELATFNANGDGVWGDIEDVIACLEHNARAGEDLTADPPIAGGNAVRFQRCYDACVSGSLADQIASCSDLPRSILPLTDFDPQLDFNPVIGCTPNVLPTPPDPDKVRFRDNVLQSSIEAENQVEKFKKRADFLANRLREYDNFINVFDTAITKFEEFLWGPAQDLVNYRKNENISIPLGLPYQAIYGWKDSEISPGKNDGLWHIVKVEARTPGRCDKACHVDQKQASVERGFPWIRTYKKKWGITRCFELERENGTVKFRVTRFDENKINNNILRFPNKQKIWNFRFFNPNRASKESIESTKVDLGDTCADLVLPDPPGILIPVQHQNLYRGAFMMNDPILPGEDGYNCWQRVHKLLSSGVSSETCAQYDWINGTMSFFFKPCEPF